MQILAFSMSRASRIPPILLVLVLICLAACGEDSTGTDLRPEIDIEPVGPVGLYVGDTITIRATVRNLSGTGVQYVSSAPEVVEVDGESGLVTAVAPGDATVTGYSAIDPRVSAQTQFTVHQDLPAAAHLEWFRDPDGEAVDVAAAGGMLTARFAITPGNARRLEVRLRERLVCEATYNPVPGQVPPDTSFECFIDTAAFDSATAEPHFLNGGAALHATLLGSGDRPLASFEGLELSLANRARIATAVQWDRTALDAGGESWTSGDATISAVPVRYAPGATFAEVHLHYRTPTGTDTAAVETSGPPFNFRLPATGILRNVTDPLFRVLLTSFDTDGEAGPEEWTAAVRYDAAAPRPGRLLPRDWIGKEVEFAAQYDAEGEGDDGVGGVHVRFHAGEPDLTPDQIVSSGDEVRTGADLGESGPEAYRLAGAVCDALDNCAVLDGFSFGVDLNPPTIDSFSLPQHAVNAGADLTVTVSDSHSGIEERPLEVYAYLIDANSTAGRCGPTVEGIDLPGQTKGGECAPDTVATTLPVPRSTTGYFRYSIQALDRAGNRSEAAERVVLIDHEPPSIGELTLPSVGAPGASLPLSVEVSDNLDLASVDFQFGFPAGRAGRVALPVLEPLNLGVPFEEPLLTRETVTRDLALVRTLTLGEQPGRTTVLADSIVAEVGDVAGHRAATSAALLPAHLGGDLSVTDPFPRYATPAVSVEDDEVCISGCDGDGAGAISLTMQIEGEGGSGRPFAQVNFLLRDQKGDLVVIATLPGEDATIANVGNRSTFRYSLQWQPGSIPMGEYSVVAVGINSRGNALASDLLNGPRLRLFAR